MFTQQELGLIIQLADKTQVSGLEGMNAILGLAMKCKGLLEAMPEAPAPAGEVKAPAPEPDAPKQTRVKTKG